jgi:hypothetical protein
VANATCLSGPDYHLATQLLECRALLVGSQLAPAQLSLSAVLSGSVAWSVLLRLMKWEHATGIESRRTTEGGRANR